MGSKRDMVETDLKNGDSMTEIVHPERRICAERRSGKERRNKKGKCARTAVWIKNDTLEYEKELRRLQIELLKLQNHVKANGLKVLMLFEGRDAAGKGGTIKRVTEHLNPRGARVVALNKPSDTEKTQWYFQRYVQHLPSAGEIVFFDRSWYNRAGVEPVMGFCTQEEHKEFLHEVPEFERMLINSGTILFKFYFSVSKKEQARRFKKRMDDPLKQYKLTEVDKKSQAKWDKYTVAKYSMLLASHTHYAPWVVIRSDNKKQARINCIKHILCRMDYDDKIASSQLIGDSEIMISGDKMIREMEANISLKQKNSGKV
jgi:polyphosphate kinase 2